MAHVDAPQFLSTEITEPRERLQVRKALEAMWKSPSVQALSRSRENNRFHGGPREATVLDHTRLVVDAMSDIVSGRRQVFADPHLHQALQNHYAASVSTSDPAWTWGDLSLALGITHDIGKGLQADLANGRGGIVINPDGTTGSPGHEKQSAVMIPGLISGLELRNVSVPNPVANILESVVAHHGDFYELLLFDRPQETKDLPLVERALRIAQENGINDPRVLATIFTNVLGDTEAGREEDPENNYPNGFGFTAEHKARGTEVFAHIVSQLV